MNTITNDILQLIISNILTINKNIFDDKYDNNKDFYENLLNLLLVNKNFNKNSILN